MNFDLSDLTALNVTFNRNEPFFAKNLNSDSVYFLLMQEGHLGGAKKCCHFGCKPIKTQNIIPYLTFFVHYQGCIID